MSGELTPISSSESPHSRFARGRSHVGESERVSVEEIEGVRDANASRLAEALDALLPELSPRTP